MSRHEVDCRGAIAVVDDDGSGPPIVVLGVGAPRRFGSRASAAFVERGFRVIDFDFEAPAGWTGSPRLRTAIDQMRDARDVMDAVGIERAHVIGVSRGAIAAFALAARDPSRVDHLVLTVPVAPFADLLRRGSTPPATGQEPDAEPAIDDFLAAVFGVTGPGPDRDLALAIVTAPDGMVGRVERHEEEPVADDERVSQPTLIVEAGRDVVVDAEHPARLRAALPHARSVRFPTMTHGSIALDAGGFVACVADFLLDRPPTPSPEWHPMPAPAGD